MQIGKQRFKIQVASRWSGGFVFIFFVATGFFLFVSRKFLVVILRVQESLAKLRSHAHAGEGKFGSVKVLVAALASGEVERHGDVTDRQHLIGGAASKLDERVLARQSVSIAWSNNRVGDAIDA